MSQAQSQAAKSRGTAIRTSKNAVMLLAGTLLRMIASFAFVIYCADRLGVEGFGKYSIVLHYFELFLSLTATAVCILLTRDLARWPRQTVPLISSSIVLVVGLSLIAPLLMVCFGLLFNYSSDTVTAILIASAALVPGAVCSVCEAVFVAKERAEYVTAGTAIESLLRIALSVVALVQGYGLLTLVMVLVGVRIALLVGYLIGLRRLNALGWSLSRRGSYRLIARWRVFAAENWMATIYTSLDVIVLSWITGEVAAGVYSAAWKIVRLGSVVAHSYTTAVFPVMSRMYTESKEAFAKLNRHSIRVMFTLALPAIAIVSVVPDRIIGLLYNEEFAGASPVLQVLIWVLLIEFLNPFLSRILFAQGKQHRSMHVAGISLAVNSVATYLLVLKWGAVGAALGTVIGGMVAMCCYVLFSMNRHEIFMLGVATSRVIVAALLLAVTTYWVRDWSWILLVAMTLVVYAPLLFLVGAVRVEDLRFFRSTFLARTVS